MPRLVLMRSLVSADDSSVKCENCGASMELNADRGCWDCPYCASEWAPETNFEGVRILQPSACACPLCKTTKLAQGRIFEYGLLYCEGCQGMLIQMGDLVPLTADLRASRGGGRHSSDAHPIPRSWIAASIVRSAARPWTRILTAVPATSSSIPASRARYTGSTAASCIASPWRRIMSTWRRISPIPSRARSKRWLYSK